MWAWDVGHTPHNFKPQAGEELTRGTPNAWGVYTADPALNLVYLPMGNATPDYFGGHRRPFDDEYSSSVVALDISTGQPLAQVEERPVPQGAWRVSGRA